MRSRPPRKKPPTPSPLLAALCTPGGNRNAAGFVCLQNQVGLRGWATGRQARQLSREKRLLHPLPSPLWFSVSVPTGSLPPGTTLGSHVSRLRSGGQACCTTFMATTAKPPRCNFCILPHQDSQGLRATGTDTRSSAPNRNQTPEISRSHGISKALKSSACQRP